MLPSRKRSRAWKGEVSGLNFGYLPSQVITWVFPAILGCLAQGQDGTQDGTLPFRRTDITFCQSLHDPSFSQRPKIMPTNGPQLHWKILSLAEDAKFDLPTSFCVQQFLLKPLDQRAAPGGMSSSGNIWVSTDLKMKLVIKIAIGSNIAVIKDIPEGPSAAFLIALVASQHFQAKQHNKIRSCPGVTTGLETAGLHLILCPPSQTSGPLGSLREEFSSRSLLGTGPWTRRGANSCSGLLAKISHLGMRISERLCEWRQWQISLCWPGASLRWCG